ncbi:trehalase family glycosidase [Cerasicoccus fimbriatus]|uniref:trehalase family glycosidase n=1 Tax=Cerasicoccus fimbriatus TaxID=3014554 RepID=UPI0022B547A5|nr:trehalase family glycosidase [Cerasicoccus sp. TK19100]
MSSIFISEARINQVRDFIAGHWEDTVRHCPEDDGTLIGLPHPYTIPCRKGAFQELYYWDTYFTTLGLLETGFDDLALSNTRNLLAQVDRFGFVPNGNRTYYLTRSQPPYLAPLVDVVARRLNHPTLTVEAYPLIQREYAFWTTQRLSPTGLSRYGQHASRDELLTFFETIKYRLGLAHRQPEDCLTETGLALAECESGWDFNSRFDHRCPEFCPIDLNANLWLYEKLLAQWAPEEEVGQWHQKAADRQILIEKFCWNEDLQCFTDYDFAQGTPGAQPTAAAFQPLWAGLATEAQADAVVRNVLPQLEHAFGVASGVPQKQPQQWDYPNAWACVQHLVYRALARYGYHDDARRIAAKYITSVVQTFEETGDLWEKYNVIDGTHRTVEEAGYLINPENLATERPANGSAEPPAMMGWTAGVFVDAVAYLQSSENMAESNFSITL